VPSNARSALSGGAPSGEIVAGVRPEDFEDASLVGDKRSRGVTFRTTIDVLESMGAESYAYFTVEHQGVAASEDLADLAADVGGDTATDEGQVVARIDPASKAAAGAEIELWFDPEKIHLFEADSGRSLTYRGDARGAPAGGDGALDAPGGAAPTPAG
jgi:multiple sugar transport system ATP-binding protein